MRVRTIEATNVPPVRKFDVASLSDIVVIAGPNGVGKTRLMQGILGKFQSPTQVPNVRLVLDATDATERKTWASETLDTAKPGDALKLVASLQRNRRRGKWKGSVLQFESDRSIQAIKPYAFSWNIGDPWDEDIAWNLPLGRLQARFQDTLHSILRKVQSRRDQLGRRAEEQIRRGERTMSLDSPDPLAPFKTAFAQLLGPKELVDADLAKQTLLYRQDGTEHPLANLSSGEREVVNIVFDFLLRGPSDCIVFFDEPELHLHPELSYKLLQTLKSSGERNQFVFSTHSPDIITASLEHSVIFLAPPRADSTNQAVVVRDDDGTNRALRLLGQSVGIVALGRRIVLIEGRTSSLDKQTYGAILRNRLNNLVLVPSGGKATLKSFATVVDEVLSQALWGVEFFMLCDRDALSPSAASAELEARSGGRLRTLKRYHLENYFLEEDVLAQCFAEMEPAASWLRSPDSIRERLRELAVSMVSYATALTVSGELRESVGNVDLMPKACHNKNAEELASLILDRAAAEQDRVRSALEVGRVAKLAEQTFVAMTQSVAPGSDQWKKVIPGKPLLAQFAAAANIDVGRLKLMYLGVSSRREPDAFQDIVDVFSDFSRYGNEDGPS